MHLVGGGMLCQQLKEVRREDPPDLQGLNLSGAAVLHVTLKMSDGKTINDIGHIHCGKMETCFDMMLFG